MKLHNTKRETLSNKANSIQLRRKVLSYDNTNSTFVITVNTGTTLCCGKVWDPLHQHRARPSLTVNVSEQVC